MWCSRVNGVGADGMDGPGIVHIAGGASMGAGAAVGSGDVGVGAGDDSVVVGTGGVGRWGSTTVLLEQMSMELELGEGVPDGVDMSQNRNTSLTKTTRRDM